VAGDTAKFHHIWGVIMNVIGHDHRVQYQANKIIISHIQPGRKRS